MDIITRSLVVKRYFLTARSPRQGVGVVRNDKHYNEKPPGNKRFSRREVSLTGGRNGDETWIL